MPNYSDLRNGDIIKNNYSTYLVKYNNNEGFKLENLYDTDDTFKVDIETLKTFLDKDRNTDVYNIYKPTKRKTQN